MNAICVSSLSLIGLYSSKSILTHTHTHRGERVILSSTITELFDTGRKIKSNSVKPDYDSLNSAGEKPS